MSGALAQSTPLPNPRPPWGPSATGFCERVREGEVKGSLGSGLHLTIPMCAEMSDEASQGVTTV